MSRSCVDWPVLLIYNKMMHSSLTKVCPESGVNKVKKKKADLIFMQISIESIMADFSGQIGFVGWGLLKSLSLNYKSGVTRCVHTLSRCWAKFGDADSFLLINLNHNIRAGIVITIKVMNQPKQSSTILGLEPLITYKLYMHKKVNVRVRIT